MRTFLIIIVQLWSEVEGVEVETKNKFSLDCTTWKVASQRKSGWSTPSFAACGTLQSKAIYEETVSLLVCWSVCSYVCLADCLSGSLSIYL